MPPKSKEEDYGWQQRQIVGGNRFHWKCKYCNKVRMSRGVTCLKKHIARGFSQVSKCPKVSEKIRHAITIQLEATKRGIKQGRIEMN